ncbi:MAG: hypothetical protein RI909_1657, partial [Bacteroidota bacterium]
MKNKILFTLALSLLLAIVTLPGCHYSMSGASTIAESIQVEEFFNNTDLGPANLGQTFTNKLKDYYQQNSSLRVVKENGQLVIEGMITTYQVSQLAPVSGGGNSSDLAALTRLTIGVKVNYTDTLDPKNNFKDRSFSFYADFPNTQDLNAVQETLEKKILDQIFIDLFNA